MLCYRRYDIKISPWRLANVYAHSRFGNFSSSTCDDRYRLIIISPSLPPLPLLPPRRVVRFAEGSSRAIKLIVNSCWRRTRAYGPVCNVQPSIFFLFEILLIIDRLPCFVIIMNGIPYARSIHHDVFFRIRFSRSHYDKSRIARAVDRSRGRADIRYNGTIIWQVVFVNFSEWLFFKMAFSLETLRETWY